MSWALRSLDQARANASTLIDRTRSNAAEAGEGHPTSGLQGMPGRQRTVSIEAYKHFSGWVFSSINAIANRVASQPLLVARVLTEPNKNERKRLLDYHRIEKGMPDNLRAKMASSDMEIIEQHPLTLAVEDPNDIMTRWVLLYVTVANLELTGRCLWWLTDSVDGTREKEIWPMPTHWVKEVHTKQRLFDHWEIKPPNVSDPVKVPGEEIACFYYPDPSNPLSFNSPLMAQAKAVLVDEMIQTAQKKGFTNGINPGHAVIMGRNPELAPGVKGGRIVLDNDQKKVVIQSFRNFYEGVERWNAPVVLDGLIEDIKRLGVPMREMDFLNSSKLSKERITQGFSTNPIVLGQVEGANRASSATAEEHHINNAVNPKICLMSECLTAWVAPKFEKPSGGRKVEKLIAFIEKVVPRDVEVETKRWSEGAKIGTVTVNEWRQAMLNLPPVHGGDVAYTNGGLTPVPLRPVSGPEADEDEFGRFPAQPDDPEPDDDDDDDKSVKSKGALEGSLDPFGNPFSLVLQMTEEESVKYQVGTWKKQLKASEHLVETHFHKVFKKIFKGIVAEVRKLPSEDSGRRPANPEGYAASLVDDAALTRDLVKGIQETLRPIAIMGAHTEWSLHAPRKAVGDDLLEQMPAEIKLEVDRFTDDLSRQPFWKGMSSDIKDEIGRTVNDGLTRGLSTDQIADNLDKKLTKSALTRAKRIARTETTGALNAGHEASRQRLAKDGIIAGKKWQSIMDGSTRGEHVESNQQKRAVNQLFDVGGEQGRYPGDVSFSPFNRANCRCASMSIMSLGAREGRVLLPQAASNARIAQAFGITPAQAQGFINLAGETSAKLLGEGVTEEIIRGTMGKILNKTIQSGTKLKGYIDAAKSWIAETKPYKALNSWWSTDKVWKKMTAGPLKVAFKGYMGVLNGAINLAGAGLPKGLRVGGYWTGLLVSQALTPAMPWLAIPGMSDTFAIGSLLGVQVPFRIFQATRWAGKKLGGTALGRIAAGGLRRTPLVGAIGKVAKKNLTKILERLVSHGNPAAGSVAEYNELIRQTQQLQVGF